MYHYTYRIDHPSGKYYVGRHSTNNLGDAYTGSGIWVKSLKDKSSLTMTVIEYFSTFEDLLEAEKSLISEHIDNPDNMNWNNSSVGFGTGNLNPSRRPEAKSYLGGNYSEYQKQKIVEFNQDYDTRKKRAQTGKKKFEQGIHNFQAPDFKERDRLRKSAQAKINNPMFREEQKERHRQIVNKQLKDGTHNFQSPEIRKKASDVNRKRWSGDGNPMKDLKIAEKFKKPKEKVICPHCDKEGGKPVMMRYHFDKCKYKKDLLNSF